jgi:hypothetical protein
MISVSIYPNIYKAPNYLLTLGISHRFSFPFYARELDVIQQADIFTSSLKISRIKIKDNIKEIKKKVLT